jgi:CDP-glycerol glycerophosphotransferase
MPRISVVLPIYNVEAFLQPCLESLAAQTVGDFEAVMVNDGSTDSSPAIAAAFAERDPRFRLITQPNGGLSAARNTGMDATGAEFLHFLDSDDVLPPNAYELLLGALDRTGSDFATGNVRRLVRGFTRQSAFLRKAFATTQLKTHVTRFKPLLADRVAWNKLWRRSFWDEHGFRFPEGMVHEDIPVVLPAHFAARSVDVIADPVYFWRAREGGELSITQRRLDPQALDDRLTAIEHVRRHLAEHGPRSARRWYDESLVADDLRLYLDLLHVADDAYRSFFLDRATRFLETADDDLERALPAIERLKWHLVRRRRMEELLDVLRFQREDLADTPPVVRRGRVYGDYPFRGDPALAVPDEVYRLDPELTVTARLDGLRMEGERVHVRGWAFIDGLGAAEPRSQKVRLVALRRGRWRRVRYVVSGLRLSAKTVRRPEATTMDGGVADASWSGFEADLDLRRLRHRGRWQPGTWDLFVTVTNGRERRRRVKWFLDASTPLDAVTAEPEGDVLVRAAATEDGAVIIEVLERPARLRDARLDGEDLELTGAAPPGPSVDSSVEARRPDGGPRRRARTTVDGDRFTARLPLARLVDQPAASASAPGPPAADEESGRDGEDEEPPTAAELEGADVADPAGIDGTSAATGRRLRPWELALAGGGRRQPLALPVMPEPAVWRHDDTEIALRRTDRGDAAVEVRHPAAALTRAAFGDDGRLTIAGTLPARAGRQELVLQPGRRADQRVVDVQLDAEGTGFEAVLHPAAMSGPEGPVALAEGWWGLYTHPPGDHDDAQLDPVVAGPELRAALPLDGAVGPKRFRLTVRRDGGIALVARRDLGEDEAGRFNQRRLRAGYRLRRTAALEDRVVFTAYGGRQFADAPRRVHDELVRRDNGLRRTWVVRDGQAVVPTTADVVRDQSREHFEALATSRFVVVNGHLPQWFERRPDQIVVQTWHGTPLKRVGLDALRGHSGRRAAEPRWRAEVRNWQYLVTAGPHASAALQSAYEPPAEVLELGSPRADILHAPGREQRAAEMRRRLGLSPDQRVVLYAPTFRDHLLGRDRRYRFELRLDLARLRSVLGDDGVLLLRKHHDVDDALPTTPDGVVRDVSRHPDGTELLLAADVLITDYSSMLFDFVPLRRPVLLFAYDLEDYERRRGLYLDLRHEAPGPVLRTSHEVAEALLDLDAVHDAHRDAADAFASAYAPHDDGRAAARVVDAVLDRMVAA